MVTVKETHVVKPAEETPSKIMYVSDIDQIHPITHAPTIYVYRSPSFSSFPIMMETLKHSLSKALVIFYPFAGRLQWTHRNRLQINCNSLGAHILEAETDARIDDFAPDYYRPTSAVRDLIPSVDYNRPIEDLPLVLVQLTKFSCGGVTLGLGLSHILADGQSALHFISEWVRIARGEGPEYPPFLDRTVLVQDQEELLPADFDASDYKQPPLMIGSLNNIEERLKESDVLMLRLSKEQIEKLRSKANEENKRPGDLDRGFTRFQVVAGHMWRTACKARKHMETQETALKVVVNFRNRVKPPLPKFFFGNAVLPVVVSSTSGELVSMPLSYAAGKIRAATEKVMDGYVKGAAVFLKKQEDLSQWRYLHVVGTTEGSFYGNPNMSTTSWMTLPNLKGGTDFGWGEEDHFGPGAVGFDGKSFILSDNSRPGSVVVALRLQVAHMEDFRTFFYEDILN
ncbi:spermidine hydroxycinnamoyl transferase-like [Impatiens glandulifera]|uniref:spermidine hydroxycinnamoyl transferase-like n=1 Tax=Impatiens glandulifera TaxID=253017 RepID=UPI001FB0F4E1|nr:spermidine hydroxycinnamoyl transferase-like [Impatiens glandulifera]XP_047333117.1 spermidine hydroxycinnamoyl transferase-like [Impatiens glandulifera]XP_047333123.1 spermidine hydroxycinnamoyl transferase-like [Impatiens glandulifera]